MRAGQVLQAGIRARRLGKNGMRQLRVIKAAKANHSFKCALEGLVAVSCASGVPLRG